MARVDKGERDNPKPARVDKGERDPIRTQIVRVDKGERDNRVPRFEGLGGGMTPNLPAAVANAQNWSQNTPAFDQAYFDTSAQMSDAANQGATRLRVSEGRDQAVLPKTIPAWMRPPINHGGYNPAAMHATPVIPAPAVNWYGQGDPHHTMNPMIDYYPDVSGPLLPWWQQPKLMPTRTPTPTPSMAMASMSAPPAWSGNGFGSSYGGNWRKGKGVGGGGGGGYGYDSGNDYTSGDYPAWMQNMGLYSWKFG